MKIPRNPLLNLLGLLAKAQPGQAPDLRFDDTPCVSCGDRRPIDGLFLHATTFDRAKGQPIYIAQIGLFEFNAKDPASGRTWSHFGLLNAKLSEASGGPIYAWQSRCPKPHCSGNYSLIQDLAGVMGKDMQAASIVGPGKVTLDCCDSCGTRRPGVEISAAAGTGGRNGVPMAVIRMYEVDLKRDFNPAFQNRPKDRWCFRGVADLSKNIGAGFAEYRWSMTCPECVRKQQGKLSDTPLLYVPPAAES